MSAYNIAKITIATPINKDPKSASNKDYQEQQTRAKQNMQLMWDDAKGNPTKDAFGAFAFVQNDKKVEFHLVQKICPTTDRLDSWSANVGQGDRNVLMLSPCIKTVTWDEWLALKCPKKVQGTMRLVSAHATLSTWLQEQLRYEQDSAYETDQETERPIPAPRRRHQRKHFRMGNDANGVLWIEFLSKKYNTYFWGNGSDVTWQLPIGWTPPHNSVCK